MRREELYDVSAKAGTIMSLNKEDVWADLMYALDELDRPSRDIHSLDAHEDEFIKRFPQIRQPLFITYSKAKARADVRNAHEAIEKGLKAILIDSGQAAHGHELHQLLEAVRQQNRTAFDELERCFDSTIQYLESVTHLKHNTNIVDYFQKHGKAEIFKENRYESIEGKKGTDGGMIGFVYREIIRALLSLIFGCTPKDIGSRIEEEGRKTILAESKLDPAWDAAEWLNRGPVRPRLEVIENLENNKVLRAAVRRCARESKDSEIQYWAERLRRNRIAAKRKGLIYTAAQT